MQSCSLSATVYREQDISREQPFPHKAMFPRLVRWAASKDPSLWDSGLLNPNQALIGRDGFPNWIGTARWGRGKLLILQCKKQLLVGHSSPLQSCSSCPTPGRAGLQLLSLPWGLGSGVRHEGGKGGSRGSGAPGGPWWCKQEEAQSWNAAEIPLVQFWGPLRMGCGLEARRFGFYPRVTHWGTIKTSLNHFTATTPLTLLWVRTLEPWCDTTSINTTWSVLQALTLICRSPWLRPPAKHLCDDKFSPGETLTCSRLSRGILKPQVGHVVKGKWIICCGARGGDREGRGQGWMGQRGLLHLRQGKGGLLSQQCSLRAGEHRETKVDRRMHPAGGEWAREKQLQHSPRALFWGELPVCGKDSCISRSDLAFPTPRGDCAWPFSMSCPKVL